MWASGNQADVEDPEDVGITRTEGWDPSYEQLGSGSEPERRVWNQRSRELDGAFAEHMRSGGLPQHDSEINYRQYARVGGSDGSKYIATVATGPATGNAQDPIDPAQTVWRLW